MNNPSQTPDMPEQPASVPAAPFEQLEFSLDDRVVGQVLFSMRRLADSGSEVPAYTMHVWKGPAQSPTADFTRTVPVATAAALRDKLVGAGVLGWEEHYPADGSERHWSLRIVFKEGVYTQSAAGGAVPAGFDDVLEALYQLDLPRPGADDAPVVGGQSGAQGAGPFAGFPDFASLFAGAPAGGPDADMLSAMQEALSELQSNPQAFQQQLKEEFAHLPLQQQEQMLDMLGASGMAPRDWWERFLRG